MKSAFLFSGILGMMFSSLVASPKQEWSKELNNKTLAPPIPGYLTVGLVNHSNSVADENVYVLVKGIDPSTNKDCYVSFDAVTGKGFYSDATSASNSKDFSFKLSQFPKGNSGRVAYFPELASGRIYFSLGYPLEIGVDLFSNKILDPDALSSNDPNYYKLFDKIEFTYLNSGVFMNPTAVDFFALPLQLVLHTNSGVQFSGFWQKRAAIFAKIRSIFAAEDKTPGKIWSNLIVPFKDPFTQKHLEDLRIASTSKGMGTVPPLFDPSYLNNNTYGFDWISNVWSGYYRSHVLQIDATELSPPNNKVFIGQVNGANQFVFAGSNGGPIVTINLPSSSYPFFAAAGDTFNAQNNTPQAIIIRDLTAAFDSGILPVDSSAVLNHNYFSANKSKFYTNNPLLPPESQTTGPWYDLYSKALHSFGNNIYTFAYDDVLGIDGTCAASLQDEPYAVITLADLRGTSIPDPYTDTNLYNVTVGVAANNPVMYQGQTLTNGQLLTNVSIPFTVELMGSDHQMHTTNIYIKYPQATPSFPGSTGIVINPHSPTQATVSFPGL